MKQRIADRPARAAMRSASVIPAAPAPAMMGRRGSDMIFRANLVAHDVDRADRRADENTIPASAQARAKSAFSDRNP